MTRLLFLILFFAARLFLLLVLGGYSYLYGYTTPNSLENNCNLPVSPTYFQVGDTDVWLSWSSIDPSLDSLYEIELLELHQSYTGTPTHFDILQSPQYISGLLSGAHYKYKVRILCKTGLRSVWSEESRFLTSIANPSRCGMNLAVADTSCLPDKNIFRILVANAPGTSMGVDVELRSIRLILAHTYLGDLDISLEAPDGSRTQLLANLSTGDDNFGLPNDPLCENYTEISQFCTSTSIQSSSAVAPYLGTFSPLESLDSFSTGSSPLGIWKLEICDIRADDVGKLRFVQLVFSPKSCEPPVDVVAQEVTLQSANISWNSTAIYDSAFVEYGPKGFHPGETGVAGGGQVIGLSYPIAFPVLLDGLVAFQNYDVYVRLKCNGNTYGLNSCVTSFFTDCTGATLEENFNNYDNCSNTCASLCPSITGTWKNVNDGSDNLDWTVYDRKTFTANTGPSSDFEGSGKFAYLETTCPSPIGKRAYLQSGCLQVQALPGSCHFTFAYHMFGTSIGTLRLEISLDGGVTFSTIWSKTGNQGNVWKRENINLGLYNNQVAVFRIVGIAGNGGLGDIGIDNLRFFGTTFIGEPSFTFYRDADNDGFGNEQVIFRSCSAIVPPGYRSIAGDCNDLNPAIKPTSVELLCNGIDENCNGNSDDSAIPTPVALDMSACGGSSLTLSATGQPNGQLYWYDAVVGGNLVHVGNNFIIPSLSNNQDFYVKDSLTSVGFGCTSTRKKVTATKLTVPELTLNNTAAICKGNTYNLGQLSITDNYNTNGILTFHSNPNGTSASQLSTLLVAPITSTNYYIKSTTSEGCSNVIPALVSVNNLPTAIIQQGNNINLCQGRSIALNALEGGTGTAPFSYSWSNGLNFQNIIVTASLQGGTDQNYTLQINDNNACSNTANILVKTVNGVTQTNIVDVVQVSACGGTDGAITLLPLNGTPPYNFYWAGGNLLNQPSAANITALSQGSYRVSITDSSPGGGCGMTMPVIVINAPGLTTKVDSIIPIRCFGESNGSIYISAIGQNPTYTWSNSSTAPQLTNVPAGTYAVTITDGNCVQTLQNLVVTTPPPLMLQVNEQNNPNCFGEANGSISVIATGGLGNYTFTWNNSLQGNEIDQLSAGNYTCTLTDSLSCSFQKIIELVNPPVLTISLDSIKHIPCYGQNIGYLAVSTLGGTGNDDDIQYLWDNLGESNIRKNLEAGSYQVIATDLNGCTALGNYNILSPDSLTIASLTIDNPTCLGVNDGSILATTAGGTVPYSYAWNTNNSQSSILSGLGAGSYQLTITDANNCKTSSAVIPILAAQILNVTTQVEDVLCFGTNTGALHATVNGGMPPYTYIWNDVFGGNNLLGVIASNYTLQVQDAIGCYSRMDSIKVAQPALPLSLVTESIEHNLCNGDSFGFIDMTAKGGTSPYSYLWSNADVQQDLTNIPAGTFTLIVTDANGCTHSSLSQNVTQPDTIAVTSIKMDIPCFGNLTGSIELVVSGGVQPYHYLWNSGQTTEDLYNLLPGGYSADIIDHNGCMFELKTISVRNLKAEFDVTTEIINTNGCFASTNSKLIVSVNSQNGPFTFSWTPFALHVKPMPADTLFSLPNGIYSVTVSDGVGCSAESGPMVISSFPSLQVVATQLKNNNCKDGAQGEIIPTVNGGKPPYTFYWSNGSNEPIQQTLSAGCYNLTVVDANNCSDTIEAICITEPLQGIQIELDQLGGGIISDSCNNCQGSIEVQVTGGSSQIYTYEWSNGFDSEDLENLCAGAYQLTVKDLAGCIKISDWYFIEEGLLAPVSLDTVSITNVKCFGENTGAVNTHAAGGQGPYQYFWSNESTSNNISNVPAGLYTVTLSDAQVCTATFSMLIEEPNAPLTAGYTKVLPTSGNNGSATLLPQGGTPQYNYMWDANANFQSSITAEGLGFGIYQVTITDANSCFEIVTVDITLATDNVLNPKGFLIFPNPSFEQLWLAKGEEYQDEMNIAIFAASGAMVKRMVVKNYRADEPYEMDIRTLAVGSYWVKITNNDGEVTYLPLVKL